MLFVTADFIKFRYKMLIVAKEEINIAFLW